MLIYNRINISGTGSGTFGNSMLAMDNRKELPPITTAFAEYFPNHKANTAPLTPPGQFAGQSPSLKRKRSDPAVFTNQSPYQEVRHPPVAPASSSQGQIRSTPSETEPAYESPRYVRQRADSAQDISTTSRTYSKSSHSPTLSKDPVYRTETHREGLKRPASTSGIGAPTKIARPRSTHGHEPPIGQHRLLPPIAGLDQSPSTVKREAWRSSSWQQDPRPSLPAAIEPRTQYQPLDHEATAKLEQNHVQRGVKRGRSPAFERPASEIKTARGQAYDDRYPYDIPQYRRIPEQLSPVNIHERPRTMHGMQPLHIHRPAWDTDPPSQLTSPTDTSPPSAHPHLDVHSRYTWDPSAYESMRSVRKRRGNLPKESTALLNEWYNQHASYPYPKEAEKQELQQRTGLHMSQISNWFINARRRRRPSSSSRTAEGLPRSLAFDFTHKE